MFGQGSSNRGRDGGFSLVELLVVLAVAAILLGLAMPSMRDLNDGSRISAAVNELVFALQTARSEAIKRAGTVALCASASPLAADASCDGAGYADGWIVYVVTDTNDDRDAGEDLVLQREALSAGFSLTPSASIGNSVRFDETGASANVAGVPLSGTIIVAYAGGRERRLVSVAANGRVGSESIDPETP